MEHGLDLQDGTYADKYIGKWGLEHEMTKGHVKVGKRNGRTPFDLLKLAADGDTQAGKLFQEFAISFKRAKQLQWARGLKKLLLIADQSDEELAQQTEQDSIELREVEEMLFMLLSVYGRRADFLSALESDYQNGCFGSGEAEQIIRDVVTLEITRLQAA